MDIITTNVVFPSSLAFGRFSIISQPSASDVLIRICTMECQATDSDRQIYGPNFFESLINTFPEFKTKAREIRLNAYELLGNLETFLKKCHDEKTMDDEMY